MEKFNYTFKNTDGLNPEKAGKLIKDILKYSSSIKIKKENRLADARIIFNVLSLNITQNDSVEFLLDGKDETQEAETLKEYLNLNF